MTKWLTLSTSSRDNLSISYDTLTCIRDMVANTRKDG